jgi:hypothetical protein
LAGIERDAPRGRRTPPVCRVKEAEIIAKTTRETPLNAAPRSTRSLAEAIGVGKDTVQRVWRNYGLKPHRTKGFKVSNDPKFAEKLVDIVGTIRNRLEESAVALNLPILQQTPRGYKAAPHQVRCIAKNLCEP